MYRRTLIWNVEQKFDNHLPERISMSHMIYDKADRPQPRPMKGQPSWRLRYDGITVFVPANTKGEARPLLLARINEIRVKMNKPVLERIPAGQEIEKIEKSIKAA